MKKIIIHQEVIQTENQKLMFQIKIPPTTKAIKGVLVMANETGQIPQQLREPFEKGQISLRIDNKLDVFFSDRVERSNHLITPFIDIEQQGLAAREQWWFNGRKREFFKIHVPVNNAIIECFYEDHSTNVNSIEYTLKIYLEIEIA